MSGADCICGLPLSPLYRSAASSLSNPAVPEMETLLLEYLHAHGPDARIPDSMEWLKAQGKTEADHEKLTAVQNSLVGFGLIRSDHIEHSDTRLTQEGESYRKDGTPEAQLYRAIPEGGSIAQKSLEDQLGKAKLTLGLAKCMSNRWIEFEGDKKLGMLKRKVPSIVDEGQVALQAIVDGAATAAQSDLLKKRGLIETKSWRTFTITRGVKFARVRVIQSTDLTVDMLKGDKWKELEFKEYNFDAASEGVTHGALHPLMKVRAAFRQIFCEMGFEEMPTNRFVESSFWNFDTLFQPQQHPARDAHDTFFIHSPARTLTIPEDYLQATKAMHEKGGYGSRGYRYDWKREESEKNILRTHTTACSSRMLYQLSLDSKEGGFKPRRYFSIDRVFRNETLDATHLAEFYQIEGLIADRNLTLGDLIGTISTFFKRIGITDVRFKPAYNPYTEPSMEIFGFSPQLNKHMELGNSGIFRPEMLRPMGLPEDVRVIAWGLGLERQTMLVYGIKNIRDLFGPRVKLDIIQKNPVCRFDKNEVE